MNAYEQENIITYTADVGSLLKSPQIINGKGCCLLSCSIRGNSSHACTSFTSLYVGSQNKWVLHNRNWTVAASSDQKTEWVNGLMNLWINGSIHKFIIGNNECYPYVEDEKQNEGHGRYFLALIADTVPIPWFPTSLLDSLSPIIPTSSISPRFLQFSAISLKLISILPSNDNLRMRIRYSHNAMRITKLGTFLLGKT